MSDGPVLEIEDLTLGLPEGADRADAVRSLSFSVAAGETLCLVGESGSGKSLTALAAAGLLPDGVVRREGAIRLGGRDLAVLPEADLCRLRGRAIGTVFQEPLTALNPIRRVGAQIAETFRIHGVGDAPYRTRRVLDLIGEMGLPDPSETARAFPHELSGGQRQRVVIAIALALAPRLLVADEPTTALDVTTQRTMLDLIARLRRDHGTAVLFVTHDLGVVADIADRVVVLEGGVAVESGPVASVLGRPGHAATRRLLASVPSLVPPLRPPPSGPEILAVAGLRKSHGGGGFLVRGRSVRAVSDVSLTLRRGETLGIVGESGSGKSTLARCVMRLQEPDAGSIRLDGTAISGLSQAALRLLRPRIQMIFQDPFASLNPRRCVRAIVAEGPLAMGTPRREALDRADEWLRRVGLPETAGSRLPHAFSGGQRQRVGLARALALAPDILVADEPVSALDVSVQAQILALLDDLQRRLGLAILFITHDLRVAARMCDRIAVMQAGRIVESGATATLLGDPSHPYTRALLSAVPGAAVFGRAGRPQWPAEP